MLAKKNINNNPAKQVAVDCKIYKIIIWFLAMVALFGFIVSALFNLKKAKKETADEIGDQIYNLSQQAEYSNFNLLDQNTDKETGLRFVDQKKLAEEYVKNLKEIITAIEQQIHKSNPTSEIDRGAIRIIKKEAMNKIVPKQYQNLHIDLIFALDSIINEDVDDAINRLEKIKNNIS